MNSAFAILPAAVIGYALASTFRIPGAGRGDVLLLRLGLMPGIGFGLLSLWYFVSRAAGLPVWVEIGVEVLAAAGAAVWLCLHHQLGSGGPRSRPRWSFLLAAIIGVAGLIASFWIRYTRQPLGEWDAWAIWNVHARILDQAGHNWPAAIRASAHPDYPVLLPLTVARLWHSLGAEPTWVPALVGLVFLMGTIAVLYGALGMVSRRDAACIGVVVLAMNFAVPAVASVQLADWPLAYFFTACLALVLLGRQAILLAGLMAGLAAWTKNEGLLFALVLVVMLAVADRRVLRSLVPPIAVVLAVVFWYKWTIHVPNDLFQPSRPGLIPGVIDPRPLLARVTDYYRLRFIFSSFSVHLLDFAVLLSPAFLLALQPSRTGEWLDFHLQVRANRTLIACAVTLLLMVAGYGAIYVISPGTVQTHVTTSVDRLFAQLWPGAVLCALAALMPSAPRPEETGKNGLVLPVHADGVVQ